MTAGAKNVRKPKALRKGSRFSIFAPASPMDAVDSSHGTNELVRLGFSVEPYQPLKPDGYFASIAELRLAEFVRVASDRNSAAMISLRGGYGSTYLLVQELATRLIDPKSLVGYSDVTSLQIYLWQCARWVTFYGPMIVAGLHRGPGAPHGYDEVSFLQALTNSDDGWTLDLGGEVLASGEAQGILLGGCLTLVQSSLGTPWELDTRDSVLLLEDTGMRPYQVDRALMHLLQAGKLAGVRGIVLGEFPGGEPLVPGSPSVRDVCQRILSPLAIPVVYGAAIGHTKRPMLTLPLGVPARLQAFSQGKLEILEPAVIE